MSTDAPTADDARYRALCARDARFDGRFFTGVTSTGIYCRPVCRVRTPLRKNCRFFDSRAQAEAAAFAVVGHAARHLRDVVLAGDALKRPFARSLPTTSRPGSMRAGRSDWAASSSM